jgi:hypothetical protein
VARLSVLAPLALATLPALARDGAAQEAVFPSHDVRVEITVDDAGAATVREEYALTGPLRRATFQLLGDPCATVEPVSATLDHRALALDTASDVRGPWTFFQLASISGLSDSGATCRLQYEVRTRGLEATVPIALPAATLEIAEGERGARVTLAVVFASPESRVLMPRLERAALQTRWEGRFLAIPSIVRVQSASRIAGGCDRQIGGSTGGLEWRFAVFAGTMAIWVPVYLWWFGRRWPRVT